MFPQQCKLIVSSAQISSGVCGSRFRRFRRVSGCAGAGSGGMFREVPEGSGARKVSEVSGASSGRFRSAGVVLRVCMCWCRCWRQVPEGSGGFRRMLVLVPGGKFRKVLESPVCGGVSSGTGSGRFRKV